MLEMRFVSLALLLALSFPTCAQMYSWREGGSLKVSTVPPTWYRVDRSVLGPRVVVTQGKRIIDDTGLAIEERLRMRPAIRTQAPALRAPIRN